MERVPQFCTPHPPTDTDLLLLDLRLDDRIDPERHNSTWLSSSHRTSFLCTDTVTFTSTCTHSFSTDCLWGLFGEGGAHCVLSGGLQLCLIEHFNTVVSSRTSHWALCTVCLWQMPKTSELYMIGVNKKGEGSAVCETPYSAIEKSKEN